MTALRKLVRAQINQLGEDEVEVVMSTAALARDGHVLIPQGCILDNYRANPIVLWSHDPEHPIGNAENIVIGPNQITARIQFAPLGISRKADEIRGLMKSGVLRAVSVGFDPIEMEPLDPKKPRGGQRISAWELLELSAVSVGADASALVTARAQGERAMAEEWKIGAAKGLPIEDSDAWDAAAAEASIFEWAGGDDFDAAKARKGFLVYDASAPELRGSYKLPLAHVVDGELKVPKGAIRAAASRLPQTDIPDDIKAEAGKVLDAYKKAAGIDDEGDRGRRAPRTRGRNRARIRKLTFTRGLYEVADLCWLMEGLGWQVDMAAWEAAIEADDSKVPAMLAAVFHDLGEALLAMAEEEIAEALAGHDVEPGDPDDAGDVVLPTEERAHIAAAASPRVRAFRRGLAFAKLRAGKTLSADTVQVLRDAIAQHEDGLEQTRSAMRQHRAAIGALNDMMDRAGVAEDDDPEADQQVQTSDGVDASEGSANGRAAEAYRRREAEALALAVVP